jgi:hypothetical protein
MLINNNLQGFCGPEWDRTTIRGFGNLYSIR